MSAVLAASVVPEVPGIPVVWVVDIAPGHTAEVGEAVTQRYLLVVKNKWLSCMGPVAGDYPVT